MDATLEHDPHEPQAAVARVMSTRGRFLAFVAVYFTLQFIARLITSPTVDLDEAEQLIATQRLAWGYGPQPPLYTWLQFPLVQIFGANVLPLCLFKNVLLFCLYALTYLNARLVTRNHWVSVAATVSLLFIPQIAWESQRDLTHSVLVTVFAAATFHVLLRLGENATLKWFLAVGLCAGCGALSKYSYVVFLAGLIGAALMEPKWRRVLLSRGGLLALAVCAVVVAPHAAWAIANSKQALATASKFELLQNKSHLVATITGMWSMLTSFVYFVAGLIVVYGIVCLKKPVRLAKPDEPDGARVIMKALVLMLGILLAGIVFFKATGFKNRWFSPLLIWLPVLLVVKLRSRLDGKCVAGLIVLASAIGTGVLVAIPGRVHFATVTRLPQRHNISFEALTEGALRGRNPRLIFAESNFIGGNLKRCFPNAFVMNPMVALRPVEMSGTECLVVWDATKTNLPASEILTGWRLFVDVDLSEANLHYISAPLLHYSKRETRLGFANGNLK